MKKLAVFLISLLCVITCAIGFTACGDKDILIYTEFTEPVEKDQYGWDITGYSVKAANTDISGDIVIPATYNDKKVIAITVHGFNGCSKITSLTIPEGVIRIGTDSFGNCRNMTLNVPSTVKYFSRTPAQGGVNYPKIINYNGTFAEWQKISMPVAVYDNNTIVHLTNGDIINNLFEKK